ncbi:MAG: hypothetical protein J5449_03690, partial [Oscillospiraceae bacterium]|nr:hypothetical protein [Oscillospiraceae bacterium]
RCCQANRSLRSPQQRRLKPSKPQLRRTRRGRRVAQRPRPLKTQRKRHAWTAVFKPLAPVWQRDVMSRFGS